jgi:beta-xylosidase
LSARTNLPGWAGQLPFFLSFAIVLVFGATGFKSWPVFAPPCDNPGWFPIEFGLKDHHVFWHDGYYYLISIYLPYGDPAPPKEDRFAYARSQDLCTWETLEPVLPNRNPGTWDEKAIWAPFVYYQEGIYYLYYTGVTNDYTQSILLATTADPATPASWETQEMVFQPNHPGTLWTAGAWADCRDPTLFKEGDLYYLYYSGHDQDGAIIGVATAPTPAGPWSDQGSIMPSLVSDTPESPTIARYSDRYYLFYTLSYLGGYYRIGDSPTGPWQPALPFRPGWAHEVWQDANQEWLTSFMSGDNIAIAQLTWDAVSNPIRPFIGLIQAHLFLPAVFSP